jgi:YjbE family integral membrane protein
VIGLPAFLTSPEFWLRLGEIGALNLLLSGDNAVVIALAVRVLPKRQRLLGQIWGTVGAVVLRLAFVGVVSLLLRVPFLRAAGGVALLWIALRLIRPQAEGADVVRHGASFWEAIWIILIADVTMSLDNVLAIAAAAHGDFTLVTLGIVSSLPIVVWGSSVLASLMNRYPWIIWTGGALLGWVAGEMILEDPVVELRLGTHAHLLGYAVPLTLATMLFVIGWWLARRQEISRLQGAAPPGDQERSR